MLEAACRVIADRGADATRFADVAAESGVPVSTLQYYFGSREDLLVAAFRHASSAEIAALEADVAAMDDPWEQLERIITRSLTGYQPDAPEGGRLWIESWHFGIRDAEMRADALRDNTAWRRLVAEVVRRGMERGTFGGRYDPDKVAVLAVAAVDGMGIPLSSATRKSPGPGAVQDVLAALREIAPAQDKRPGLGEHRRVQLDQGLYEERYRLTGSVALSLAVSLGMLALALHASETEWLALAVLAFVSVTVPALVAAVGRKVAFRADPLGITFGAAPLSWPGRDSDPVFIPWSDVQGIVLYGGVGEPGGGGRQCIGIQRRPGAPRLPRGNEPARRCPVPGLAEGATRQVVAGGSTASG